MASPAPLANDPVLLLADEPTGNLDSRSADEVLDLFSALHRDRGLTLVVVTHSPEVARRRDACSASATAGWSKTSGIPTPQGPPGAWAFSRLSSPLA